MANDLQRINATKYELESPFEVSKIVDPVIIDSSTPINVTAGNVTVTSITNPVTVSSITNPVTVSSITNPITINQPVTITGLNLDAFERLRVSLPGTQYEYNFQYNEAPLIWQSKLAGSGTATHRALEASVRLSTGITRTASQYKNVGYFDSLNGIFFGQDDTGIYLTLRSSATGSTVDRKVYQTDWNIDHMDGTGRSGYNLDITKTQILVCQLQWLGVGTVSIGFEFDGILKMAHQFYNTNLLTIVYMTTANLPMRYEISDGASGVVRQTYEYFRYRPGKSQLFIMTFNMQAKTVNYLDQICATVITEGSIDNESYYEHSVDNSTNAINVSTRRSVLSIRPKATFNSIVNRGKILVNSIQITGGAGQAYIQLVYGGTLGGTPSWNNGGANSLVEYDVAGTTVTGGEIIFSDYIVNVAQTRTAVEASLSNRYPLTLDIDGLNPKLFSIVMTSIGSAVQVLTSIQVREFY